MTRRSPTHRRWHEKPIVSAREPPATPSVDAVPPTALVAAVAAAVPLSPRLGSRSRARARGRPSAARPDGAGGRAGLLGAAQRIEPGGELNLRRGGPAGGLPCWSWS